MYTTENYHKSGEMMTDRFIIANEELAFELDAKLEKLPFRDRETFVQMYNSGLVNRKNEEVSKIVDSLIEAYKGIEKKADGITFLDMGEISADELVARAEAYSLLLRLKRIAKEAASENLIGDGSKVYVGKGNGLYKVGVTTEDGTKTEDQLISNEKLPKISNTAVSEVGKVLEVENYDLSTAFDATKLLAVESKPVIDALDFLS